MPTKTILEHTLLKISSLPAAASLAVIFDPYASLNLAESIEDEQERTWQVIQYDGNDLAFRKRRPSTGLQVIWVVLPDGQRHEMPPRMTINSQADIWFRADLNLDASLPGILRELVPSETWPVLPLWEQTAILGQNLQAIPAAVVDLRRYLDHNAALDESAVRAVALHCLHPSLPAHEFLFQLDTPVRVLQQYLTLLWDGQWNDVGRKLLQIQAQKAPRISTETIHAWLNAAPVDLARYIYLRRALIRFGISNPVNQLRGLGVLEVDPELLEPQSARLIDLWDHSPEWSQEIIVQAESSLTEDGAQHLADLFEHDTLEKVIINLQLAETPVILSALMIRFVQIGLQTGHFELHSPKWLRPEVLTKLVQTRYSETCVMLANIIDEVAFIDACRKIPLPDDAEIARLLEWYTANKIFDLEYAHARAFASIMRVPESIRDGLRQYLNGQRTWIKGFLNDADHLLASSISANWNGYLGHTRLSTNVLWDTVKKKRIRATTSKRIWVVVFDGMRWDTWMRHIRPRLLNSFEVVDPEKPYLSLLPSWTRIARTGLLAGKVPGNWLNEQGRTTNNQSELAARLLEVRRQELRFSSNMESDNKLDQFIGQGDFAYNVMIYNISDDNLHAISGSLVDLNKTVDGIVERVIQDMIGLIGENDQIVISSDHGFTELIPESAISIADDSRWQRQVDSLASPIRYRYIVSGDIPQELIGRPQDVIKVEYKNYPDKYLVPVGSLWFKRAEAYGSTDRYSHGGVSFAEMVVPGAVLKRITQRTIKPEFEFMPKSIIIQEGESAQVIIRLMNKGNTLLEGSVSIRADLGGEDVKSIVHLQAGESQEWNYPVVGIYRKFSGGREESTKAIKVILNYQDTENQETHMQKRVPITVQPRTDKVEIDFGGLSDFDE